LKKQWVLPSVSAEFVYHMEDVLDLYAEPYDPARPVVCLDESPKQLIGEVLAPLPVQPGHVARYDHHYQRNGTRNLFILFQPLGGWRHVKITEHRTTQDYAQCLKDLVDIHFPEAEVIRVVQDNLNTHTPWALYETFPPQEAKRILERLEFHYTPKHASWLNMAEIELGVLNSQCLDRRIGEEATLQKEVAAWEEERNAAKATVNWRFTTTKARGTLKRLYPS
jgi:hypothetical protein